MDRVFKDVEQGEYASSKDLQKVESSCAFAMMGCLALKEVTLLPGVWKHKPAGSMHGNLGQGRDSTLREGAKRATGFTSEGNLHHDR
eukprot:2894585-Rhodomonas_salina.2